MINLIEEAKKRYWIDENRDGINDKFDYGLGGDGTKDFEKNSPDGTPGKGKLDIDCSHLISNTLKAAGYKIPYFSTSEMKSERGKKYFDSVTTSQVKPGDIIIIGGHVAIVESYNTQTGSGTFFGSQSSTGPGTTEFGPNAPYWNGTPIFLRPKEEFAPSGSGSPIGYFDSVIKSITTWVRQLFTTATTAIQISSPLLLDLDGDGVETTLATDGAYFDHDANGFAEQTAWAGSDDGLLVLDRNGNGVIDNGKELFGTETLLKSGSKASSGFQALSELDGNKDGKIDINDSAYNQLRIWQDYDGDGYSSPDELRSLSELGIASINTGYTSSSYIDPNGNQHRLVGGFTKSDGSTGATADVWFKTDKMYTIGNEWLDVPEAILALPDLQGFGNVYDLQQAMVRDAGGALKGLLETFITQTDPLQRGLLIDQILFKWTGSDTIDPASRGPNIDARKLSVLEKLFGQPFVGTAGPNPNANAAPLLKQSYEGIFEMIYSGLMAQTHLKDLYDKITYTWDEASQSLKGSLTLVIVELQNRMALDPVAGKQALGEFARSLRGFEAENLVGYWGFRDTFAVQGEELAWIIDSTGKNILYGTLGNDTISGSWDEEAIAGGYGNDTLKGGDYKDVLYGQAGADKLWGETGDDLLDGGEGNDQLTGGDGNDRMYGQGGIDYFYGGNGDDTLYGGLGDDYLFGEAGNDTLDGGAGNDSLQSWVGNDVYLFGRGYGVDTILDNDATVGNSDTLRFASDVARSDVVLTRSGDNMVFKINGTSDQVVVQNWMAGSQYQVERVEFGDGSVLAAQEITNSTIDIYGTSGNDTLKGSSALDRLYGYGGNDNLWGNAGDDLIDGGDGSDILYGQDGNDTMLGGLVNDTLYGGAGNDMLDGGSGNDYLSGDAGSDTYLFGRGYGVDTINEYDPTVGNSDKVKFGSGVNPLDIIFFNNGNNINIQINNSLDLLIVRNQNLSPVYQVEEFEASDGSKLLSSKVNLLIQAMADFSAQNGGMSWTQLIQNRPEDVQTILSHYWQPPT